ncbi:hypothetical protein E8E13_006799 [Curvularia kusanoi]|uniref:2EXR domain-containing protein n=1 Tax=Curvularia kusanoi TaxID=90978 RepID=A0A9P4TEC6_CURKU|nr:hypothetical protein E8E13_006799 [Curvularia kusanoi]
MAPHRPTVPAKPAEEKVKNENNKVAKRPARGYHRHRNGFLNVRPKGREMDIVRSNQDSPLLRLPSEIRNTIWEYALGHNTFRAVAYRRGRRRTTAKWVSARSICIALLQTCRQIYMEAASMPFYLNTFAAQENWTATRALRLLKIHQRKLITLLRIEPGDGYSRGLLRLGALHWELDKVQVKNLLPALNTIDIVLSGAEGWPKSKIDSALAALLHSNPSSLDIGTRVRAVMATSNMAPVNPNKGNMTAQGTAGPATVSGRVSKRPPRRKFHRYRSGFLNVAPKRHEKKITLDNQRQSPLLRLPPELRNMIWAYALGDTVYRGDGYENSRDRKFAAEDPSISPKLLETCRQIYSETAMLPFRLNTFSLGSRERMVTSFEAVRPHQRRQIKVLRFEVNTLYSKYDWIYVSHYISKRSPSLKYLEIFFYGECCRIYSHLQWFTRWRDGLDLAPVKLVVRWSEKSQPER